MKRKKLALVLAVTCIATSFYINPDYVKADDLEISDSLIEDSVGKPYNANLEKVYRDSFSKVNVTKDRNGYKFSVYIKSGIYNHGWSAAFDSLYYKHSDDSRWSNTYSLRDQFICHYNFARQFKSPWNLETWRPGGAGFGNRCNPE